MAEIKASPFRRTRQIKRQIEEFLDRVSEASLAFEKGVGQYLDSGPGDEIEARYEQIAKLESRGDELQREIELTLYSEMLLPDVRGDVLSLLDDLDHLLDGLKRAFLPLVIECPEFPSEITEDAKALTSAVARCVETAVLAARTYFREPGAVRDHTHKIGFHESEADRLVIRLRRWIAGCSLSHGRKLDLRMGVMAIDAIANAAEEAGDRMAIYAVKRSL